MPDLKGTEPALSTPVTAGGVKAITLGGGASPAIAVGSGAPSISAPKGSLYLRTDGAANARIYVATDAVGTWLTVPLGE